MTTNLSIGLRTTFKRLSEFWFMFGRQKKGLLGLIILIPFIFSGIFAPLISPYDPWKTVGEAFSPPNRYNILGNDDVGRDILSQLIWGTRVSLLIGFLAAFIASIVGIGVGLISGYFGGYTDTLLMGLTDTILILPGLVIMIIFAAYLGGSIWNIIMVIAMLGWITTARTVRSQVLSLKESVFVEALRAVGLTDFRIIFYHILPNVIPLVFANMVLGIVAAILSEAGLSFLGLGDPTHQSWGMILYYAQTFGGFVRGAWWWILPPGICITLVAVSFIFIGQALDEVLSPRLRQR